MFPRFMSRVGDANLGLCTRVHAFLEKDSSCPVLLEVALTPFCHVPVKSQSSTHSPSKAGTGEHGETAALR